MGEPGGGRRQWEYRRGHAESSVGVSSWASLNDFIKSGPHLSLWPSLSLLTPHSLSPSTFTLDLTPTISPSFLCSYYNFTCQLLSTITTFIHFSLVFNHQPIFFPITRHLSPSTIIFFSLTNSFPVSVLLFPSTPSHPTQASQPARQPMTSPSPLY